MMQLSLEIPNNCEGFKRSNQTRQDQSAARLTGKAPEALRNLEDQLAEADEDSGAYRSLTRRITALRLRINYPTESLQQLADRAGISKSAYWRLLKRAVGEDPATQRKARMSKTENPAVRARAYRRQQRHRLVLQAESILGDLREPVTTDDLTTTEVSRILGMSMSALTNVIRRNYEELLADGYTPGRRGQRSTLTRRGIFRIALIMRPGTSEVADEISKLAGYHHRKEGHKQSTDGRTSTSHVQQAVAHMDRATELALAVRDEDPADVWDSLSRLDRYQLQALSVTLAALLPVDATRSELTGWLEAMAQGRSREHGSVGAGLGMIIPTKSEDRDRAELREAEVNSRAAAARRGRDGAA